MLHKDLRAATTIGEWGSEGSEVTV